MNYSWILLALFLVTIISGIVKAITRPMIKNILRLAAVILAFLVAFILQICGVFQNIVVSIVAMLDLVAMLPILANAMPFINALAGSLASPIIFIVAFYLLLGVFYLTIFIVMKIVDKKKAKKEEIAKALEEKAEDEEASEEENAEVVAETEENVEVAAETEEAPKTEAPKEEQAKPKKKKKPLIPKESAPQKVISICTAIIGAILIFGISCMPLFHAMEIVTSVTDGLEDSDADDSMIYQVIDVADNYFIEPYENSFVIQLYDGIGIVDLMDYTASQGGKMTLANGQEICADEVVKNVLSHGASAITQLTSGKSEYKTLKEDLDALINDPYISSILVELISTGLDEVVLEEPAEDDVIGGLVNDFVKYYQDADASIIESDLKAVSATLASIAKTGLIVELTSGEPDLSALLSDEEVLSEVVVSISGLSAFGPTIEGAFEFGIDMLGSTLQIPETDQEIYNMLMDDLSKQMTKDTDVKFDYRRVQAYIYNCAKEGKAPSVVDKDYNQFAAYLAQWKKIHKVFSNASEDKSLGCLTFIMYDVNGKATTYVYDEYATRKIVVYDPENKPTGEDGALIQDYIVSEAAELINYLTHATLQKNLNNPSRQEIYAILEEYVSKPELSKNEISKDIASRILDKENFESKAVTMTKLYDSTDFTDWTAEEKEQDSKYCVSIIVNLMSLMDTLGSSTGDLSVENASSLIRQLDILGETMDIMQKTSCVSDLPEYLLEGVAKSDMCKDYIDTATAHSITYMAKNGSSYSECMKAITSTLISFLGSMGGK